MESELPRKSVYDLLSLTVTYVAIKYSIPFGTVPNYVNTILRDVFHTKPVLDSVHNVANP